MVATLRMQHGPACPLGHLWFWGRGHACRSHLWPLVVIRGVVVIVVLAGCLQSSLWCWPSVAGHCPLCTWLSSRWAGALFWAAEVICGGVAGMTWLAGNMEVACSPGDVGMRLLGLVGHLSWFVGGVGCWSWWTLLVGRVVV